MAPMAAASLAAQAAAGGAAAQADLDGLGSSGAFDGFHQYQEQQELLESEAGLPQPLPTNPTMQARGMVHVRCN